MKTLPKTIRVICSHLFWLYLMLLVAITVIPTNNSNSIILSGSYTMSIRRDYLLHALFYVPLPVMMNFFSWSRSKRAFLPISKKRILQILLFSLILAIVLELSQLLIYYLTFNVKDLAGNLTGVLLGFVLILLFR